MEISVVIPTLNESTNIARLIPFLKEHGGGYVGEIIVVDGGSTDDTVARARDLGVRVLETPRPCRAIQMNLGARHARSEILYFVHADTRPPTNFASLIAHAFTDGLDMGCFKYRFDSPRFLLKINAWFSRFNYIWCQGGDKTFFIKAETFRSLGGYDEHYVVMEEYDFIRRARRQYRMQTLPHWATVSARKYRHNSWARVQLANMYVFALFRIGVEPQKLKRIYQQLVK